MTGGRTTAVRAIQELLKGETMGYVKPTAAEDIAPETLEALARLAGFAVRPADAAALAASVRDQLASVQSLEELDLTDIAPALEFDPRWES